MITQEKINGDAQMSKFESKDSYILNRIYEEALKGEDYVCKEYPRWSHVDTYCQIKQNGIFYKWNTEIKSANLKGNRDYPSFKLKEQKLKDAVSVSKGLGLWICFLDYYDGNAYFYNVKAVDWKNIEKRNDYQLKRYVQPELGYDYFPTYFLPKDKATQIIPFKKYADEYE